jgi:hypothetical protein
MLKIIYKSKKISLLMLAVFSLLFISQIKLKTQSMHIKNLDGTEKAIDLNTLGKVTFSSNNMVPNFLTGEKENYSLSKIKKVYFSSIPINVKEYNNSNPDNLISIYPNPTDDLLYFTNVQNKSGIEIYNLFGTSVLKNYVQKGNSTIDVSNLLTGTYIIKINNKIIKFVKI